MRLGFGQLVLTDTEWGINEKAGQSHGCFSAKILNATQHLWGWLANALNQ
jgi:hypothetical protein